MSNAEKADLKNGVLVEELQEGGTLLGVMDGEDVLLVRRGAEFFAVGANCTHYHGPLHEGLVVDDTVRCPWHHACFSLRTGEALRAPALDSVSCWRVEHLGDIVFVRVKLTPSAPIHPANAPSSVVIVGGGAAGLAAADMLRRDGYDGPLTILSADDSPPSDRPNLSKDFLAGTAKDDWIPLRAPEFYTDHRIDLVLNARVSSINVATKRVELEGGQDHTFGKLLIATGAEPVKLDIPGAKPSQLFYLRSFADSKAIVARAASAKTVLVVGASFIGLEVAASLRARELAVHVVAPEGEPLERIMGPEVGRFIRKLHEDHGVVFHLGQTVKGID